LRDVKLALKGYTEIMETFDEIDLNHLLVAIEDSLEKLQKLQDLVEIIELEDDLVEERIKAFLNLKSKILKMLE